MSPVEEAVGGGGKHACAINRGGEPADADGSNQLANR
jgi:hypothetical protein